MEQNATLQPAELAAQFVNYTDRHIFLTGKAGTGKTTFLRQIVKSTYKKAVIVAPTGIAAINASGVTIHSMFQLPFGTFVPKIIPGQALPNDVNFHTPTSMIRHLGMNSRKRKLINDLELLIIDEVSMLRADVLDAIDFVLRFIRRTNENFGGVQVLFIGDLYQLSPVVKRQEEPLLSIYYQSPFFFDALCLKDNPPVYVELEHIYRQEDPVFINLLNNLRNNTVNSDDLALLKTFFKADFIPDLKDNYITLTTHNYKADAINTKHLKDIEEPTYTYEAVITKEYPESMYPVEQKLELKLGAQVMFIKNDQSIDKAFFNGMIGEVTYLDKDSIQVLPEGLKYSITVSQHNWENIRFTTDKLSNEVVEEVIGTFSQYPIKLAWAVTVHKSQGLTFSKAVIDIGQAFAPGQIYVALSRLRSLDGLVLTSHLNQRGLTIDQHVAFFAKTKEKQEQLDQQLDRSSQVYIKNSLTKAFDFTKLDREIYEHVFSYNKDENHSVKQRFLPWASKLQTDFIEKKAVAAKFLKQLAIIDQQDNKDLLFLLERVEAAAQYFCPYLKEASLQIFAHIEEVKKENQTKEYLLELIALEQLLDEQWRRIIKSKAMIKAKIEDKELIKNELHQLLNLEEREKLLLTALTMPDQSELNIDENNKTKSIKQSKPKKEKKEKIDTKAISLALFKDGKNIKEIAKEREMVVTTIEGHLAHYIAKGELKATALIEEDKLETILKAIRKLKTTKLVDIYEELQNKVGYGEIKIALAAWANEQI